MTDSVDNSPSSHAADTNNTSAVGPFPLENVGGRKFALIGVCVALYTLLLVGGYVDQNVYFNLQIMTVGAFIASNTAQKFIK